MKLFRSHRSTRIADDLLRSTLFDEESFFKIMSSDIKSAQKEIIIESPFVTIRRASEISKLFERLHEKGVSVIVHTRNPEHHDGNLKFQSVRGIAILRESGAKVKIHDDMRHRKICIVDRRILWEGSLNMLSHSSSKEIMRRTESEVLSKQMLRFAKLHKSLNGILQIL